MLKNERKYRRQGKGQQIGSDDTAAGAQCRYISPGGSSTPESKTHHTHAAPMFKINSLNDPFTRVRATLQS